MSLLEFTCVMWTCIWIASRSLHSHRSNFSPLKFYLVRELQRAPTDDVLALENTPSLDECIHLALEMRGMAINYATIGAQRKVPPNTQVKKDASSHLTVWQQPGEFFNCHVLQCPQNLSSSHMINDSRFDYYSLYSPPTLHNYSCIPKVGLFILYLMPKNYQNASQVCSTSGEFRGSLAHIASSARTLALAKWMFDFNQQSVKKIFPAYVGLKHNNSPSLYTFDFRNAKEESLLCFFFRAWKLKRHYRLGVIDNSSCVALTIQGFWENLSCERQLPFICEILTISGDNFESGTG